MWLYRLARRVRHIPFHVRRRLGREPARLTGEAIQTVTINTTSFAIALNGENGVHDQTVHRGQIWEPPVTAAIYDNLQPGGVFVDVGANIGYYSLLAAAYMGPDAVVHAFEPIPALCAQIKRSIAANNFNTIQLHEVGCAEAAGTMTLHTYRDNIGKSSLQADARIDTDTLSVPVVRLDDVLANCTRVDVIKLDIEGYEYEAFQGATDLLARTKPVIIFEVAVNRLAAMTGSDVTTRGLFTLIYDLGYDISTIKGDQITDLDQFIARQRQVGSHVELIARPQ